MSNAYGNTSDQELISRTSPSTLEGSTFDKIKSTVADKLRLASHALDEKAVSMEGQNDNLSGYGRQTARWLDKSAAYIDEADPERIKNDLKDQVRQHPGRSLLIAGAVGLLIGAIFRRR